MSFIPIRKSDSRFLPVTLCLILVALVFWPDKAKAQGSQVGCHEIAVLGAVKTPGRLEIQGRMQLVEVLKRVGGASERAGKVVRVIHFCNCSPCAESEVKAPAENEYNLSVALAGKEEANPYVVSGDLVVVPEAELVFVIGNGSSQKSVVYREGVTLTQAIGAVGNVAGNSELVRVRLHRNPANGPGPLPLIFTLKAVLDKRNEDPVLQPRDIIEISDETGKFSSPFSPTQFDPPLPSPARDPQQSRSSN